MLNSHGLIVVLSAACLVLVAGCAGDTETEESGPVNTSSTAAGDDADSNDDVESENGEGHGHAHAHGEDDALVWEGDPQNHEGLEIKLGHHATHLHAGESVEPAVSITRDGEPVSDAEVFNSLWDAVGQTMLAEEVATVYEPETPQEPAHYAQGELEIPEDVDAVVIRFRIVPADGEEATFDIPVDVE